VLTAPGRDHKKKKNKGDERKKVIRRAKQCSLGSQQGRSDRELQHGRSTKKSKGIRNIREKRIGPASTRETDEKGMTLCDGIIVGVVEKKTLESVDVRRRGL